MITESPSPSCDKHATPTDAVRCASPETTSGSALEPLLPGVAFFDFDHGQTGVAPNAIELHLILGFRCLVGR